ncbi:hypothetical protein B0H13DRAFT_1881540 [Mycena leptocephala]|nr:hypothetical protein B0H13DRAFT_1881540 [Mycena leptocephala]
MGNPYHEPMLAFRYWKSTSIALHSEFPSVFATFRVSTRIWTEATRQSPNIIEPTVLQRLFGCESQTWVEMTERGEQTINTVKRVETSNEGLDDTKKNKAKDRRNEDEKDDTCAPSIPAFTFHPSVKGFANVKRGNIPTISQRWVIKCTNGLRGQIRYCPTDTRVRRSFIFLIKCQIKVSNAHGGIPMEVDTSNENVLELEDVVRVGYIQAEYPALRSMCLYQ